MNKILLYIIFPCFALFMYRSAYAEWDDHAHKVAFMKTILPLAIEENHHILADRERLIEMRAKYRAVHSLNTADQTYLHFITTQYKLPDFEPAHPGDWDILLSRVDIIPLSLVLSQAANESGWGTSRYAVFGHSFFGQSCYVPGCGIAPIPTPDKWNYYEVQTYPTVRDSVKGYLHNLNTNEAYSMLRRKRKNLRSKGKTISGRVLATGLQEYSELGNVYIHRIIRVMTENHFEHFDNQV